MGMTWTEAMLERLLRIDGQRIGPMSAARRLAVRRALGAYFPDLDAARQALGRIEAENRRGTRAGKRFWTSEDHRLLRQHYANTDTKVLAAMLGRTAVAVWGRARSLGLKKSPEVLAENARRYLHEAGKAHRFKPGHRPPNRGVKGWDAGGRSHETRFKKGQTAHTWVPIGSIAYGKGGYLKVKVSDDRTKESRFNWCFVHHLVWEKAHGRRVPKGHVVIFVDGDPTHITIENLKLITLRRNMLRNSITHYPAPLRQAIQVVGQAKRALHRREREYVERDD